MQLLLECIVAKYFHHGMNVANTHKIKDDVSIAGSTRTKKLASGWNSRKERK